MNPESISTELPLYSAVGARALDRLAIERDGVEGYALMKQAGASAWRAAEQRWPQVRQVDVLCGPGNNGGDGYVVAQLARDEGREVRVWTLGPEPTNAEARQALHDWQGPSRPYVPGCLAKAGLIVDAMLGVGARAALRGDFVAAVEEIEQRVHRCPVLAIDVPTGLDADTGHAPGRVVHADLTVSFVGHKFGLHTGSGPECVGELVLDTLGLGSDASVPPLGRLMSSDLLFPALQPRPRSAHKGSHGHVLIVAGAAGMGGAALMAGRAALRCGAGLVSLATHPGHAAAMFAAQPELMVQGIETPEQLDLLLERASVVAVGPGLGTGDWSRSLWRHLVDARRLDVVDADALNLLAEQPLQHDGWILTPHPGEAARLLGIATAEIQRDRLKAVSALCDRYGGTAVLKGSGTLVSGRPAWVCPFGNPGMAVGGMGDVLTGVIAAMRAQGQDAERAAALGVLLHARAGDAAARSGERGLLPSDVIEALRMEVNP